MSSVDLKKWIFALVLEWWLLAIGLLLYLFFPFFSFYFEGLESWGFYPDHEIMNKAMIYLVIFYVLLSPILLYRKLQLTRTTRMLSLINSRKSLISKSQIHQILLTFCVKFFFIPLMYLGAVKFGWMVYQDGMHWYQNGFGELVTLYDWINQLVFPMVVYIALFIALVVYLLGYTIESTRWNTAIKSVDSNAFSWIVTLICYLPFFAVISYVIPLGAQEFAYFKNESITNVVRIFIMLVILFKTWTIFSLGMKSSNLTNRGIVSRGAYAWVRHPHYLSKLVVWWVAIVPSALKHPWLLGGMIFWTVVYVLRALMEEEHLKKDPEYKAYMKKVKWRFIPKIF